MGLINSCWAVLVLIHNKIHFTQETKWIFFFVYIESHCWHFAQNISKLNQLQCPLFKLFCVPYLVHWLRAGWSGDRIPVGARFSAPVHTGPGAHPAFCTIDTGSFPGVKSGQGVALTPHPLLMSRAIPLLPLWAVRPVQSLSACTRVHFTFFFFFFFFWPHYGVHLFKFSSYILVLDRV